MAIQFTKWVGVSPGTTTVEMSGLGWCPPDALIPVLNPTSFEQPAPPATSRTTQNPYANEIELNGLRGLRGAIRWDLGLLAFGLAFAGVLGYSALRK